MSFVREGLLLWCFFYCGPLVSLPLAFPLSPFFGLSCHCFSVSAWLSASLAVCPCVCQSDHLTIRLRSTKAEIEPLGRCASRRSRPPLDDSDTLEKINSQQLRIPTCTHTSVQGYERGITIHRYRTIERRGANFCTIERRGANFCFKRPAGFGFHPAT